MLLAGLSAEKLQNNLVRALVIQISISIDHTGIVQQLLVHVLLVGRPSRALANGLEEGVVLYLLVELMHGLGELRQLPVVFCYIITGRSLLLQ
jgi:hypothetical protein